MKAKVIETGEWIDICKKQRITQDVYVEYGTGKEYTYNQLALESEDKLSSYWFDLRNKYAGMVLQGMMANKVYRAMPDDVDSTENDLILQELAAKRAAYTAIKYTDALIEGLRKEV